MAIRAFNNAWDYFFPTPSYAEAFNEQHARQMEESPEYRETARRQAISLGFESRAGMEAMMNAMLFDSATESYQALFGGLKNSSVKDEYAMRRLSYSADLQPKTIQNHAKNFKEPKTFWERLKWLSGVDNPLDQEVQKLYDRQIAVLENTQPTSPLQLKRVLAGFWHTDRMIDDYLDKKYKARGSNIESIFFTCMGCLLSFYYKWSTLKKGPTLEERSQKLFAQMASFSLNGKTYDVIGQHICSADKNNQEFTSNWHGKTYIGIYEKSVPHNKRTIGPQSPFHNFSAMIATREPEGGKKLLYVDEINYKDQTEEPNGSDRLLDKSLTQIMIEVLMQNGSAKGIEVKSSSDQLPVLLAAGFPFPKSNYTLKELQDFRSQQGHRLFPPHQDYGSHVTALNDLTIENVYFTKGNPVRWRKIIRLNPILHNERGVLPDFWA